MLVIAIDGPAGAGKSTIARLVAAELGVDHLDTGAMYRAVAHAALRAGVDPADAESVAGLARSVKIEAGERTFVDGVDVTDAIRDADVTGAVSSVAAIPEVRTELVGQQRRWAERRGGVVEGRDIGTVVFPDAPVKVYLTARPDVRAARRFGESATGQDLDAIAADIARRDEIDASRIASPMRPAVDAVEIDTSERAIDDIVAEVVGRVRAAAGESEEREKPTFEGSSRRGDVLRPTGSGFLSGEGPAARVFYRVAAFVLRVAFRLYFRATVEGVEHVPPDGAFVLAPVHRSNLDTPVMGLIPRRLRFMGKDSLWKGRVGAWLLSALGGFPVSRGEADRHALEQTIELLRNGEPVVLFPEGERKEGPRVQPLFDGAVYVAARTQVPIVPVGIGGSDRAMGRGARFIRPARIHLVVGEPVAPPALKASGRVPRKAVQTATDDLRVTLQDLYDRARGVAGT